MLNASDLLEYNNTGDYIVPSSLQYPHQWLWDTGFHAVILAYLRPELAIREIESLFKHQWDNGMIPHLSFNPYVDQKNYRPNREDWNTGRPTSGITQPPLVATPAKIVYQKTGDIEYVKRVYPSIKKYHEWIKKYRDAKNTGLAVIIHPWESGMDNSPGFDNARDAFLETLPKDLALPPRADTKRVPFTQRPTDDDYRHYWGLIYQFQSVNWDPQKMVETSFFCVEDVLFNSIWAKANADLSLLASEIGEKGDAGLFLSWSRQTKEAIRKKLWYPGEQFFYSYDVRRKKRIPIKGVGGFMPLYCEAATLPMADALMEHLMDRREFYYHLGVPSVSYQTTGFDPDRYWRGPIWINIHWLMIKGLIRYGFYDIAKKLVAKSRDLTSGKGYWEYYDPFTGQGLGASHFSWSTLADIMTPLDPPKEFQENVLVISHDHAEKNTELRTLYLHPDRSEQNLTEDKVTSGPPFFTQKVIEQVEREAVSSCIPISEEKFDSRLRQTADIVKESVQQNRGEWKEYPRFCDLASISMQYVLKRLGYKSRIIWTFLHYFVEAESPQGKKWIVDISGHQFAVHPVSRIPLLIERATVIIRENFLGSKSRSWAKLEILLEETQFAVERSRALLNLERMDRYERQMFLDTIKLHRKYSDELLNACSLPQIQHILTNYINWLSRLIKIYSDRRNY